MALFAPRRPTDADLADQMSADRRHYAMETFRRVSDARSHPRVLRASGQRIERMSAERLRIVAGNRQSWQSLAWSYRDMVPELRYALQFRRHAISRVRFYVAQILDDDEEPIALAMRNDDNPDKAKRVTIPAPLCAAAEDELARLPMNSDRFTGVWSENWDTAGDCFLHGYTDDTGDEQWKIRSVLDVDVQGTNVTIKDAAGQPRAVRWDEEELYRLWVPHPAHEHLADSALNAGADVLEDICLIGRELRAAARSRIAANGMLFLPDSMTQVRAVRDDEDSPEGRRDQFMSDLAATFLAPIANEGDAGAVVPAVLTGNREDIGAVRFERFEREESPILLEKLGKSLGRLANSLDIPPEILTGMADVNHWTAWQIDNATFRHHLEPSLRIMVDSLTEAFLRPALLAAGHDKQQVRNLRVWYDAGSITENPNRRQDALDALDRILIGPAAGREALGFNDGDAPTPEEALQLIAAKNGIDQSTAAAILAWMAKEEGADVPPLPTAPAQIGAPRPALPPAAPQADAPGGTGTPDTAPSGIAASAHPWPNSCVCGSYADASGQCVSSPRVHAALLGLPRSTMVAAAAPGYRLAIDDARELADIDTALRDQILVAADKAATEALRRAGSRLRSKATADQQLHAALRSVPIEEWAARIGPDRCQQLRADRRFLLAGAWEGLRERVTKLVGDSITRTIRRVQRMLKVKPDTTAGRAADARMRAAFEARVDAAWARFEAQLDDHLSKVMFGQQQTAGRGEAATSYTVPPALVRDLLADIGGQPETSGGTERGRSVTGDPVPTLSSGSVIDGEMRQAAAIHIGFQWRYGYMPRDTFEPHLLLDGSRFTSWRDDLLATTEATAWLGSHLHPGDHRGCLCTYFSVYALPDGGTPSMVFSPQDVPAETTAGLQREFLSGDLFEQQPATAPAKTRVKIGPDALAAAPLDRNSPMLDGMERMEVQQYKGTKYSTINAYLRVGSGGFFQENVETLDAVIDKSPITSDVVVLRGVKDPRAMFGDRIDGDLTGLEWLDDAYLSTSADDRIATDFAAASDSPDGGMVMTISVGKGAPMLRLSDFAAPDAVIDSTSPEAELLGGRGWKLKIIADHGRDADGLRLIDVEVTSYARNGDNPWERA